MSNETLDLFELRIRENLERLSEEKDEERRNQILREIEKLSTKLSEAEAILVKSYESQRSADIEEQKMKLSMEATERDKDKTRKDALVKAGVGILSTLGSVGVGILTLRTWKGGFDRMLKFEETGRFVSQASRELRFPRLF